MVQAAAAVAKAATTATTVGVGAAEMIPAAVTNAVTTAPVIETGIKAATAVAETAQATARTAETGMNIVEAAAPEMKVAGMIDTALKTRAELPENLMTKLVEAPAISAQDTALITQRQTEIQNAVRPQMVDWEKSYPPTEDIEGWITQRMAAEREFTVNEGVRLDLEAWQKQKENQPPDKTTNPKEYEVWHQRFLAKQDERRQIHETLYDQMFREQEEKRRGMSRQEFLRRYAELLRMRSRADYLRMKIQELRVSKYKDESYKSAMEQAEGTLAACEVGIAALNAALELDATMSNDSWKKYILPGMAVAGMVAAPIGAAANET